MLEAQEKGLIDLPGYEHVEDEMFPPSPPPAAPERDGEGAETDEEAGEEPPFLYRQREQLQGLSPSGMPRAHFQREGSSTKPALDKVTSEGQVMRLKT